jgi:hypothetical protein
MIGEGIGLPVVQPSTTFQVPMRFPPHGGTLPQPFEVLVLPLLLLLFPPLLLLHPPSTATTLAAHKPQAFMKRILLRRQHGPAGFR